jgi:hypothetical protein
MARADTLVEDDRVRGNAGCLPDAGQIYKYGNDAD